MFEKLLSALPYNPSLVHQLGFYAKRMRREESVRRTGLVFIALSFFVQFFAVVSPPRATASYSNNDMINGGIQSQSEAVSACKQNIKNYGDVLTDFGVSCADVAAANVTSIKSTDTNSGGSHLYSMGWLPENKTNTTYNDLANVSEPLYARRLDSFDTGPYSTYKVLKGTSHVTNKTFFIIFDCGNLVFFGVPQPIPQPAPAPSPTPTPTSPTPTFAYPACDSLTVTGTGVRTYSFTDKITNTASSFTVKGYTFDFGDSHSATVNTTKNSATTSHTYATAGTYTITASAGGTLTYLTGRTTIFSVTCQAKLTITNTTTPNPPVTPITPTCPYAPSLPADSPDCKPCDKSANGLDTAACIVPTKTATNQTQNIANADGSTANPGDTIVYTLHASNTGKAVVSQFPMTENLSDVLDYAVVKDLNGGSMDSNSVVAWPAQDIAAGGTETHTITVQIKSPIPNTPPDPGDPAHFDHIMTNVYGNTVNIKLPGSIVTAVATASTTLPNTGPGSSLVLGGAIVVVAGYFFARARLLHDESIIAVQQTASHGGM